jgi:uncharacterized membrane protein YccC
MDTYGPPPFNWYGWHGGPRRSATPDPNMRVSDAERSEMADLLSKHYADGRLDEAEFKARLDRAMSAKTGADLSGLLGDLPPLHPEARPRPRHLTARRLWWAVSVFAVVFVGFAFLSAISWLHVPWALLIILFAILMFRRGRWHHHHHHHAANY